VKGVINKKNTFDGYFINREVSATYDLIQFAHDVLLLLSLILALLVNINDFLTRLTDN